jgi:hypothetical protein
MHTKGLYKNSLLLLSFLSLSQFADAELLSFGGHAVRFKGAGDKVPPNCQVNYPTASTEAFFIKWACADKFTEQADIVSELWVQRKGDTRFKKIDDFLGFPASVEITESLLNAPSFEEGLPATFRVIARDRAGNASFSAPFSISAQDNSVETCSISITTEATESSGSTTGVPSLAVESTNFEVTSSQTSSNDLSVRSLDKVTAQTCDIESLCSDENRIRISSNLLITESSTSPTEDTTAEETTPNNSASGTIIVSPGNVTVDVTGTVSVSEENSLESLELSGETTIDGVAAQVELSCSK